VSFGWVTTASRQWGGQKILGCWKVVETFFFFKHLHPKMQNLGLGKFRSKIEILSTPLSVGILSEICKCLAENYKITNYN